MVPRPPRRLRHREVERRVGQPVPGVHQRRAAAFGDDGGHRGPVGAAVAQEGRVLRHAGEAVARLPPHLGGDEGAGRGRGHWGGGAGGQEDASRQVLGVARGEAGHRRALRVEGPAAAGASRQPSRGAAPGRSGRTRPARR